jgi:hypothetical protein
MRDAGHGMDGSMHQHERDPMATDDPYSFHLPRHRRPNSSPLTASASRWRISGFCKLHKSDELVSASQLHTARQAPRCVGPDLVSLRSVRASRGRPIHQYFGAGRWGGRQATVSQVQAPHVSRVQSDALLRWVIMRQSFPFPASSDASYR